MTISCRVCLGEAVRQPWGGSLCTSCGSISVTELPGAKELEAYYVQFNQHYHGGGRTKGAKARQARYARAYLGPLLALAGGKRLLDIGSSTNPFPNLAVDHGYNVTVMDYLQPSELDSRVNFVRGNIEDDTSYSLIRDQRYDVVTAFQVIEHCRQPQLVAEHMVRLCGDKGYVVVATPLVDSFADRNALGRSAWFYPPEHIHLLSTEGMTRMFASNNCRLVSTRRYELNSVRWLLRYGLAYLEGWRGYLVRHLSPHHWARARAFRTSRVQELVYYIFQKQ